jgi:hypothetical protein
VRAISVNLGRIPPTHNEIPDMADERTPEITMDPADMYREELYTDRKMGSIRRLTPVTRDGSDDPGRKPVFVGQAQLLTPVGTLPLSFEIEAGSLEEAISGFPAAAKTAVDQAVRELQELRREAASSIVLPESGAGGLGPAGLGGPGGGKIQMP